MSEAAIQTWERFKKYLVQVEALEISVDSSRMRFDDAAFEALVPNLSRAFESMDALERGAIANPDENRMVGHYWLRTPALAPSAELRAAIESTLSSVRDFAADVHLQRVRPPKAEAFDNLLIIGIGGSALGPQLVSAALGTSRDRMRVFFFDNTDPDGFDRTLGAIGSGLAKTLVVVISKSGGTKETRNGMLEAKRAFEAAGLDFARQAVAVTGENSELDRTAKGEGWLRTFPMWDWVGGRTSELSAVGLLPAALQGLDIDDLLAGARAMDEATRVHDSRKNPAGLLAAMWFLAGAGQGKKAMVVIPYKDRLELFGRYLQQLVMESLGKAKDSSGRLVEQGLVVYGNKGSTDQHAYVQQLRDGQNNFFATFVRVLEERAPEAPTMEVEPGVTSGDYLEGFWLGTREALYENGRDSITITMKRLTPATLGALIALYERAVGLYASLIGINAYHQPGVEAGKKAAARVLVLQGKVLAALEHAPGPVGPDEVARLAGESGEVETVFHLLEHLAASAGRPVRKVTTSANPADCRYAWR